MILCPSRTEAGMWEGGSRRWVWCSLRPIHVLRRCDLQQGRLISWPICEPEFSDYVDTLDTDLQIEITNDSMRCLNGMLFMLIWWRLSKFTPYRNFLTKRPNIHSNWHRVPRNGRQKTKQLQFNKKKEVYKNDLSESSWKMIAGNNTSSSSELSCIWCHTHVRNIWQIYLRTSSTNFVTFQ